MEAQKERWQSLCEQILIEQDPTRFIALVDELNTLLEQKAQRIDQRGRVPNLVVSNASWHGNT
jgi:hypothetical protein